MKFIQCYTIVYILDYVGTFKMYIFIFVFD